jgi:MYXO-CTERM domain-containing protein
MSRHRLITTLFALVFFPISGMSWSGRADAIMVEGVEFTDLLVIDAIPATDIVLTTTEDVYVFVPNGLVADTVVLNALEIIVASGATFDVNELLLCTSDCPLASYDLSSDVLLRVFEPVGNLEVQAGGSIVVSPNPIPGPSTALLLASGLAALAVGRRRSSTR